MKTRKYTRRTITKQLGSIAGGTALFGPGIASALALTSLVSLNPSTPLPAAVALSITAGALSFGWNGVFLAEVVNLAPPNEVGSATGGSLLFLYGGIVVGPTLVTLLVSASGGYTVPLCGIAAVTLLASLNLLAR